MALFVIDQRRLMRCLLYDWIVILMLCRILLYLGSCTNILLNIGGMVIVEVARSWLCANLTATKLTFHVRYLFFKAF